MEPTPEYRWVVATGGGDKLADKLNDEALHGWRPVPGSFDFGSQLYACMLERPADAPAV